MKKLLVLMVAIMMTFSLVACGGADTQDVEEVNANPSTNDTDTNDWPYENVTQEHIQALSNVLTELEPMYNEAAALAVKNGWEADELTVQELNTVYVLIDAAKHGVADPSEYGDITKEDMDTVVEQYQTILGAMPALIEKVSEPFGEE